MRNFTVYISGNDFNIAEGDYSTNEIVGLLRTYKQDPAAIQFITDTLEI